MMIHFNPFSREPATTVGSYLNVYALLEGSEQNGLSLVEKRRFANSKSMYHCLRVCLCKFRILLQIDY